MLDLLQRLQDTAVATGIREGDSWFPWIECVHVLGLTLVVGSIAIVDLRLLGIASRDRSVVETTALALPITWSAFTVAALSGTLLFASNATVYAFNGYFRLKLLMILIAGLNMAAYHLFLGRRAEDWHRAASTPVRAKVVGGLSLALWLAIVACGRWIGFTLNAAS